MTDPLITYLHDHLAGSHFAVQLLESLGEQYPDSELGMFAATLCAEVKQDQHTLEQIIAHVGRGHLDLAEATGWLGEKISEFKLRRNGSAAGLGTFEALETLTLGIRGKLALWQALRMVSSFDPRLSEYDFDGFITRAENQYAEAEKHRLKVGCVAFQAR